MSSFKNLPWLVNRNLCLKIIKISKYLLIAILCEKISSVNKPLMWLHTYFTTYNFALVMNFCTKAHLFSSQNFSPPVIQWGHRLTTSIKPVKILMILRKVSWIGFLNCLELFNLILIHLSKCFVTNTEWQHTDVL